MQKFKSKLGSKFCIAYLTIFLLTAIFGAYFGELAGIYAVFVTLPWSILFVGLLDSLGDITWYDQFAQSGNLIVYEFFAILGLLPAALMNAFILYFIGKSLDKNVYKNKIPLSLK